MSLSLILALGCITPTEQYLTEDKGEALVVRTEEGAPWKSDYCVRAQPCPSGPFFTLRGQPYTGVAVSKRRFYFPSRVHTRTVPVQAGRRHGTEVTLSQHTTSSSIAEVQWEHSYKDGKRHGRSYSYLTRADGTLGDTSDVQYWEGNRLR